MDITAIGASAPAAPRASRPRNGSAEIYTTYAPTFQSQSCGPPSFSQGNSHTHLAKAPEPRVSAVPARSIFVPMSLEQLLGPTGTIVTNSATPSMHAPAFKRAASTNNTTPEKIGLADMRLPAGISNKLTAVAPGHIPPNRSAIVPAASLTLTPSSSLDLRINDMSGEPPMLTGGKRRLGMGRGSAGYLNKKFKIPGS